MIETGPEVAAKAAWDALKAAVERSAIVEPTGQPAIDRAVQEAHLHEIEQKAFAHLWAVRELLEAVTG